MLDRIARAALVGIALLGAAGCSCTPQVEGVLATDTLPAGHSSVHTYNLVAPASGELSLTLTRQDGRSDYAGLVSIFVTPPDCASVTDDPVSLRNGQTFVPRCAVLANSFKEMNCCLGNVTLAFPAHVRQGDMVKVFVYGLDQPGPLPFVLRYASGDAGCRPPA